MRPASMTTTRSAAGRYCSWCVTSSRVRSCRGTGAGGEVQVEDKRNRIQVRRAGAEVQGRGAAGVGMLETWVGTRKRTVPESRWNGRKASTTHRVTSPPGPHAHTPAHTHTPPTHTHTPTHARTRTRTRLAAPPAGRRCTPRTGAGPRARPPHSAGRPAGRCRQRRSCGVPGGYIHNYLRSVGVARYSSIADGGRGYRHMT